MKRAITEARGEESKIPVSATQMTDDDHTKDPVKSKEKKKTKKCHYNRAETSCE